MNGTGSAGPGKARNSLKLMQTAGVKFVAFVLS